MSILKIFNLGIVLDGEKFAKIVRRFPVSPSLCFPIVDLLHHPDAGLGTFP